MASLAEHYRAHRKAFTLALELDCTPAEAAAEIARREARECWKQTEARLLAKRGGMPDDAARGPKSEPWMMRD
ncbi:hypothetical protein [Allopontixanthobacter sp.]|uniref:hypothetical protein n=1 Tax=Allopontixanthobacter sp. TaxID=2906452 RepID=UPI002ABB81BC|nr:hypothetical protein [Allopontixanthobacter sp.]MDZ4308407.1 hypothetical protein [Allopontixanthobacter sp.]